MRYLRPERVEWTNAWRLASRCFLVSHPTKKKKELRMIHRGVLRLRQGKGEHTNQDGEGGDGR
jgi:hypothetical protein